MHLCIFVFLSLFSLAFSSPTVPFFTLAPINGGVNGA